MNDFRLIDPPQYVNVSAYEALAQKLAALFMAQNGVLAVYQLGQVRDAGISDLDLLLVCADDCHLDAVLLNKLTREEKYLLPHAPFVLRESDLAQTLRYVHFTNFTLLAGAPQPELENNTVADPKFASQLGFEFLLNFYISFSRQCHLGWVKERGFLLQARALLFDLDLLALDAPALRALLRELVNLRQHWFTDTHPKNTADLIRRTLAEVTTLLQQHLTASDFCLPAAHFALARHIHIRQGKDVTFVRRGLTFPRWFDRLAPDFFAKVRNKLARFEVTVPGRIATSNSDDWQRFACLKRNAGTVHEFFPGFIAPGGGISYFYLNG